MECDRRDFLRLLALGAGAAVLSGDLVGCGSEQPPKGRPVRGVGKRGAAPFERVIVLGIDGLDPKLLREFMAAGKLPNFTRLAGSGAFSPLRTSNPPQSPVAWSCLATGLNPGGTGIFDFIQRDPKTYLPNLSLMHQSGSSLLGPSFEPVRQGTAFWNTVAEAGIPATAVKWPMTFPPEPGGARVLAGLGVPDIRGGLGTYALYAERAPGPDEEGADKIVQVTRNGSQVETVLRGPRVSRKNFAEVPLRVQLAGDGRSATAYIQAKELKLSQGSWTPWTEVEFKVGLFRRVWGTCRFYPLSLEPGKFELYVTPIHIDPRHACFRLSAPDDYCASLADSLGLYATLGMPEDTKALTEDHMDEEGFFGMCWDIIGEQEQMLLHELESFRQGLLGFVFFSTDRIQHIFWVTRDPGHPAYDARYAQRYGPLLERTYARMDEVLGKVLPRVDERTMLLVCSDHGFTTFRRSFHVNSWLCQEGYMSAAAMADDPKGGSLFRGVDWSRTRAYALGFGSIYLNLRGRERDGIVGKEEAEGLLAEMAQKLLAFRDPQNGQQVVQRVFPGATTFRGAAASLAPDLVLGLADGHRFSWQTAIGGAPRGLVEDNLKKWTGDHLMDADVVPGIFLTSSRLSLAETPCLLDLAPTVPDCFGLPKDSRLEGRSLLAAGATSG